VRDCHLETPVADADIRIAGGNVFLPPRTLIVPPTSPWADPAGSLARTNRDGTVDIMLAGSRPNDITITASGYPPLHATIEVGVRGINRPLLWTTGRVPPVDVTAPPSPRLEFRVVPVSAP